MEVTRGQMPDIGTAGVARRTQPLRLSLLPTQAGPSWPQRWSGEEVTRTRWCRWHKKLPQGVWGEPAVAGSPAYTETQAAVLGAARLDTATHQQPGSSFGPHHGRGCRGGQRGLPAPHRKPCLVLASLTPSCTAARRAARLAWLRPSPASTLPAGWEASRAQQAAAVPPAAAGRQRARTHGAHRDSQPDPGLCTPAARAPPARSRARHRCSVEQQ